MKKIIISLILLLLICTSIGTYFHIEHNKKIEAELKKEQQLKIERDNKRDIILESYNKYVITTEEIDLYKYENNEYIVSGKLGSNQTVELKDIEVTYETCYFPLETFKGYYVNYEDVSRIEELNKTKDRYKNYIPFNENIVTNDLVTFYNNDELVYKLSTSYDLPILIKEQDKYGVEFNNQLLFVNKSDVKTIYENTNTDQINTSSIAVLNYHFFYDEDDYNERRECNQIICTSTKQFRQHLDYIKNNNIFTPTLNELEMYLDGKINLPKSVVITIDDGWRLDPAPQILGEYKLNGTAFLITSWYNDTSFINDNEYFEFHSHGEDIHNPGICSGEQGGAILCLNKNTLLDDLAKSRAKLNQTKYFCYPFYEYNSYSINVLQEAGFTMAFIGGDRKAYKGVNKYAIPRYVIYSDTTVSDIASMINE